MAHLTGIVLAAGAGVRAGGPKALRVSADGTSWLALAAGALQAGGCDRVIVVLGARADDARGLVPASCDVVVADDWELGMSASLRAGLRAAASTPSIAAIVSLVDLPGLPPSVVERVVGDTVGADDLRHAVFDGRPGHPVVIGRAHWEGIAESVSGDRGARDFLAANGATDVECGDLWDGQDIDGR